MPNPQPWGWQMSCPDVAIGGGGLSLSFSLVCHMFRLRGFVELSEKEHV